MESTGIVLGFAAAAVQSVSYLFSRMFVRGRQDGVTRLAVTAHIIMGVVSLIALPWLWRADVPPFGQYAAAVVGTAGFYLAGQAGFFYLLRTTDASRVSPLLGLKIVVLALITVLILRHPLNLQGWVAVLLCAAAAMLLNLTRGMMTWRTMLLVLAVCTFYSLSDLNITALVRNLQPLDAIRASVLGVCLSYILCGVVGLAALPAVRRMVKPGDWAAATPFAVTWLGGMVLLFGCFGTIGPLYGNVLQSTRGVISILFGGILGTLGMVHIEERVSLRVLLQSAVAGVLMTVAIWLFQTR